MAQIFQNIRNDIWMKADWLENCLLKLDKNLAKVITKLRPNAGLLCNCICIGYPAMQTLIEMQSSENANCKQWKFYWIIFGFFRLVDYFAECISFIIPIYWPLKCIFFVWLFTPSCLGAATLYENNIKFLITIIPIILIFTVIYITRFFCWSAI
ncbi:Receptor expression-enhancing protein 5 [Trichinella nelsoni]|uniref:Receptor expression-enhancing protein n=1 Tax=Trichinella nelsoni TaxID=6336 RepID=A0A0V0RZP1_9BILA|nr:Receptor expression-enhancing protein 5 [Trichinella nelsoni]